MADSTSTPLTGRRRWLACIHARQHAASVSCRPTPFHGNAGSPDHAPSPLALSPARPLSSPEAQCANKSHLQWRAGPEQPWRRQWLYACGLIAGYWSNRPPKHRNACTCTIAQATGSQMAASCQVRLRPACAPCHQRRACSRRQSRSLPHTRTYIKAGAAADGGAVLRPRRSVISNAPQLRPPLELLRPPCRARAHVGGPAPCLPLSPEANAHGEPRDLPRLQLLCHRPLHRLENGLGEHLIGCRRARQGRDECMQVAPVAWSPLAAQQAGSSSACQPASTAQRPPTWAHVHQQHGVSQLDQPAWSGARAR